MFWAEIMPGNPGRSKGKTHIVAGATAKEKLNPWVRVGGLGTEKHLALKILYFYQLLQSRDLSL